jgi:hypothetical protein
VLVLFGVLHRIHFQGYFSSRQLTEIIPSRRGTPSVSSPGSLIPGIHRSEPSQPTKSEKGHGKGKEKGKEEVATLPYPETSPGIAVRRLDEFIASLTNTTAVATVTIPCIAVNRGVCYHGKHFFFLFVSGHNTNPSSSS